MRDIAKHVREAEDGVKNICLPQGVVSKVIAELHAGSEHHCEILMDAERTKQLFTWLRVHDLDPDFVRGVVVVADGDGQVIADCYVPDGNGSKQVRYIEAQRFDGKVRKIAVEPVIDEVVVALKEPWPW